MMHSKMHFAKSLSSCCLWSCIRKIPVEESKDTKQAPSPCWTTAARDILQVVKCHVRVSQLTW